MILLAVETQNLSYAVINSGTSWSENSSAIISSNICFCYPKLMLEMLNLSQLGNMLFVAPAIVDESSWIEETTKCAGTAICSLSTTFRKERNEVG